MSTTLVKPAEVERKWYLLDAAGKSLGHVAAEAAVLLRGKQKVDYTPNVDCGDFVVVINCDQAVLTGKKADMSVRSSCDENRWISLGNSAHVSESTSSEYVITR